MKETVNFQDIHENEILSREQQRNALESLSGFQRLSEKQKQYILASLYVQQRAERATDPVSASRIGGMPEKFKPYAPRGAYIHHSAEEFHSHEQLKRYFPSQLRIMNENCHDAITLLEGYQDETLPPERDWHDAGPIASYSDLEELIFLIEKQDDVPLVIQILEESPKKSGDIDYSNLYHTVLLLGQNPQGEFMVWEKSGFNMPFQLISLKQVYETYAKATGWRIRPLSV